MLISMGRSSRMCQRKGQWILDCFMALLMDILALVGGGYRFCRGSFGVAEHYYISAIELLSSLELEVIIEDFGKTDKGREIKQIIRHYRDMSETQLVTIKDLLRFMLTIKSRAPMLINKVTSAPPSSITRPPSRLSTQSKPLRKEKSTAYRRFSTVVACMDSRWPTRRLEFTAEVIVDALKENQAHGGMTRQDLRDAARLHIGNTGLLDPVLKAMNNVIVGNHVVCRTVTQSLEFWNIPSVRLVMRLTFLSRKKKHLESFLQYHLWCQVLMFTMIWLISV